MNGKKMTNKEQVDAHREQVQSRLEELTIRNAEQSSDIHYIKDTVEKVETLLITQNVRIGKTETAISRIHGVASVVTVFFGSVVAYIFKKGV